MKLREVNRSATVAWGHTPGTHFLAAATVAGTMTDGFESTGTLEFFSMDFSKEGDLEPVASITTNEKVHKLAWGTEMALQNAQFEFGVLAGAMESGVISLWNPVPIIDPSSQQSPLLALAEKHSGAVKGLDFNPFQGSLLASGGLHGEVYIWDLNSIQPYAPGTQKSPSGDSDITSIGWNRQVRHILATSTANGMAVVWDLRAKRAVLNFKDSHTPSLSSLAWNPSLPTQLVTCSDDDSNPVIHVWDLKNTFAPLKTLQGHSAGILSLSWCPSDSNLLLSCGKDHRTLCWDLSSSRTVGELSPSDGWSLDVQWSPVLPTVAARSSLPGKIELFSVNDFRLPVTDFNSKISPKTELPPPPSWLLRPCSVNFSFGGKLVSVPSQKSGEKPPQINIRTVVTEPNLVKQASNFHDIIKSQQFSDFCQKKSREALSEEDHTVWDFLRVLFQKDARGELLTHLGFDREQISKELSTYIEKLSATSVSTEDNSSSALTNTTATSASSPIDEVVKSETTGPASSGTDISGLFSETQADDFDFASLSNQQAPPSPQQTSAKSQTDGELKPEILPISFEMSDTTEAMVTKSLLVGNFQAAVDCCFSVGRLADALVLAAFGGQDLLKQTHARYLSTQKSPFMHMVSKIARREFEDLVNQTQLEHWHQVLAILCTYAKPENFQGLCALLGRRLYADPANHQKALLCYICAGDIENATHIWVSSRGDNTHEGDDDLLQSLIEKTVTFSHAINQKPQGPKLAQYYTQYAHRLASQGSLELAFHYISMAADPNEKESPTTQLYFRLKEALSTTSTSTTTTASNPQRSATPHSPPTSSFVPSPLPTSAPSSNQPGAMTSKTTNPSVLPSVLSPSATPSPSMPTSSFRPVPYQPSQMPTAIPSVFPPRGIPPPQSFITPPTSSSMPPAMPPMSTLTSPPLPGIQRGGFQPPAPTSVAPPVFTLPQSAPPSGSHLPPPMRGGPPTVYTPAPTSFALPPTGNQPPSATTTTETMYSHSPPKQEAAQVAAPPTNLAAPKARHHEEGDDSQAQVDVNAIIASVQALLSDLKQRMGPENEAHIADSSSRVGEVIDKLQGDTPFPPSTAALIGDFFKAVSQKDFGHAHQIYNKLSLSEHYTVVGSKAMIGVKRIMEFARKFN